MADIQKSTTAIDDEIKQLELEEKRQRLEMTRQQVAEFAEKQADRERVRRIRVDAVKKEKEEVARRQKQCRHKTGGKGKPGFLHGDGAKGYCVAQNLLPTGEMYMMCTRCQHEWHHPNWIIKIEVYNTGKTTITRAAYDKLLAEYDEALGWDHPYTELSEASQFKIPLLDMIEVNKIPFAKEEVTA